MSTAETYIATAESEQIEEVDLLVVGGGKAGKTLAMEVARSGQSVVMVERGMIGGTCINVACIPTKTLINSGRVLQTVRRAAEFGVADVITPQMDLELLRRRKEDVVSTMVKGQLASFVGSGMDFILGEASFIAPRTVRIALNDGETRIVRGADVVLNLGTEPLLPMIPGLADADVLTSNDLVRLDELPASLLILGGGYIGCEFADLLNTIGVAVTLIQGPDQLLPQEDAGVAEAIEARFIAAGIHLRLGDRAVGVVRNANGTVTVSLDSGDTVDADELLVAVGRQPVTVGIGLDIAGVQTDKRGYIIVDEYLRTTANRVWAAGDVAGTPQFTHASYDDYRILAHNLEVAEGGGILRSTVGRLIPYCVFMTPELGRVGLTERDALAAGYDVRMARMPVSAIPRARTVGHLEGQWSAVIDRETNLILGASLLSTEASEVIAVVQVAMLAGMQFTQVRDAVLTHPTMAEGLTLLFSGAFLED
ncbi:dihydrolipoyl dehydrogenase family protein [Leifsonia sp. A12D58]|uniref:dihydrolipoyl dehydrogenase family protein n=1 Tax=Leifsonia sp. A12D58 TaxID=3397674 RepID=UPI0039E1D724